MADQNILLALRFVIHVALGMWLGKIFFFSFFGAPQVFEELDRGIAGDVVNSIFPWYYLVGIILGLIATGAGGVLVALDGFKPVLGIVVAGSFVGLILDVYSRQVLIPKMEEAGEKGFEKYHGQSVRINGLTIALVSVALIASHLF